MERIKYDINKIKIVGIDEVRPNPWNPKDEDTEEYRQVVESIKLNGLRVPIVVRENNGLEIIDGEQRWRACKELGYENILIYNEGIVSDKEAMELTAWYEVQVPFNDIKVAQFIGDLVKIAPLEELQLPYPEEKLQEYIAVHEFDWNDYEDGKDKLLENQNNEVRTLSIPMTKEQLEIVREAMDTIRQREGLTEDQMTDARCLELICADYLAN